MPDCKPLFPVSAKFSRRETWGHAGGHETLNGMPPHWPERLAAFPGKSTRNLSFNRYKRPRAEKRGSGEMALILDELTARISDTDNVEQILVKIKDAYWPHIKYGEAEIGRGDLLETKKAPSDPAYKK